MPPKTNTLTPTNDVAPVLVHSGLEMACEDAQNEATRSQIEELRAAKDYLVEKTLPAEDAIKAFARAADAIKNGIRVFISYKQIHRKLAESFRDKVSAYGQSRLARDRDGQPCVFVAERGVEAGTDFRKEIHEAIEKAHWFILLLSDAQFDREWPIWEAGYFERGMTASERLICIHHKSVAIAKPFAGYKTYGSAPEELQELFNQLFFEHQAIPGMKQITFDGYKKNLILDTKELSDLFIPDVVPDVLLTFIDIKHREGTDYDKIEDLLSAPIVDVKHLPDAFGLEDSTFRGTFQDLVANLNGNHPWQPWIEGLRCALQDAVKRRAPRAIEVPFFGARRQALYRPNLHCVWRNAESREIDHFQVVFTRESTQRINAPQKLDALETGLRWSYRSWWEIYRGFAGSLTRQEVEDIYRYTLRAEQEAQSRGVTDPDILLKSFEDPEDIKLLRSYFERYFQEYRNPATEDGKIDVAFRERDPKKMRQCLDDLEPMSLWFLKVAAKRFAELVGELR